MTKIRSLSRPASSIGEALIAGHRGRPGTVRPRGRRRRTGPPSRGPPGRPGAGPGPSPQQPRRVRPSGRRWRGRPPRRHDCGRLEQIMSSLPGVASVPGGSPSRQTSYCNHNLSPRGRSSVIATSPDTFQVTSSTRRPPSSIREICELDRSAGPAPHGADHSRRCLPADPISLAPAVEQPPRLDAGHRDESQDDLGGHGHAPLVVGPRPGRHLEGLHSSAEPRSPYSSIRTSFSRRARTFLACSDSGSVFFLAMAALLVGWLG